MDARPTRTHVVTHVANALARPIVALWLQGAEMSDPLLPRPDGPGTVEIATHHSDRVLLIGNGAAVGYGVLTHDLALAGNLRRLLTASTGRAAHVSVIADGSMTAGGALEALRSTDLESYDAIVATVGVNEALRLSSADRWQREIEQLVAFVQSPAAPKLRLFFVGVPPVHSIAVVPRFVRSVTDRHSRRLNSRLAVVCAGHERVTFVPFEPGPAPDFTRYRSSETYREWARLIVDPIARGLEADRP